MRAQVAVNHLDLASANALASLDEDTPSARRKLVDEALASLADAREHASAQRDAEEATPDAEEPEEG